MNDRYTLWLVLATFSLLSCGCGPESQFDSRQPDSPVESAPSVAESADATDLSIPRLAPRPVVWFDELPEKAEPVQERRSAQILTMFADRSKAGGQYASAESQYLKAIETDPTWGYPVYQLACNYELWGRHDQALEQFNKAVEVGFDDFPTALTDDELGAIRETAGFAKALSTIRERYIATGADRVGQAFAVRPAGDQPADGWPVMLLLHGYGDSSLSYLDEANAWADLGFLSVAVPGSVPAADDRYMWSMDSTEPTHADLQAIVSSPLLAGLINRDRVYLLGFSQGALHAILLTAEHPDLYAGVVSLSPGGSLASQLALPPLNTSGRPARIVFIHGAEERHAPFVRVWSDACSAANWPFRSQTHPGSHHFPEDWNTARPPVATFLLEPGPASE